MHRPKVLSLTYWFLILLGNCQITVAQPNFEFPKDAIIKQFGDGESITFRSKALGEVRELRVYLPSSYQNSITQFPVIYAFDGEGTASVAANAARFMTGYSSVPQMPEAIVVGIVNANRNRDMPIPEGYGNSGERKFLSFLSEDIVPLIEKRYRTQPLRILLGHSQGGLFAHYAFGERPETFRWVVSIDAPLAGFAAARLIMEKSAASAAQSSAAGRRLISIENLYGWRKEWPTIATKASAKFVGSQIEMKDETHETMAFKAIYEGLKTIFRDYAPNLVRERKLFTLADLKKRYDAIADPYGYKVEIPLSVLLLSADQNLAIQHGAEALELAQHAVSIYGQTNNIDRRLREAQETVKKGRDPRLEEWANMAPPSADAIAPFLGTWERKDDAVWVIEFALKDGVASALNTVKPPSFEPFHLDIQFIKVLGKDKIQWGERNGRGPGTTVFTATLSDGNTLEGTAEQIGFIMPRPAFKFIYKRPRVPATRPD